MMNVGPESIREEHPQGRTGCPGMGAGKVVLEWLDSRTGIVTAYRKIAGRILPGGASWCRTWPSAILFLLVVQAVTGVCLWMHYSPSAQTAWESVYYIQYRLPGGWLVRGIHHYSAQLLVAVTGLYLVHLVFSGGYRPPREWVWWTALILLALSLGGCLTGDLLCWDVNGYSATNVRVGFLTLLPGIGETLYRLAVGGPTFGHHTLTRFFALHVSVIALGAWLVFGLHWYFLRRSERLAGQPPLVQCPACRGLRQWWKTKLAAWRGAEGATSPPPLYADEPYWPGQFFRNAVVWLGLMVIILLLVFHPWKHSPKEGGGTLADRGARLLAPADPDPAAFYAAARPEWSFRGLYQLSNLFPSKMIPGLGISWRIVPIFVLPGLVALFVLAMPFIALWPWGHVLNVTAVSVMIVALVGLTAASYWHDAVDPHFRQAVAEAEALANRVKFLAARLEGIPPQGALSLVHQDPKIRGPKLFSTHCVICHDLPGESVMNIRSDNPSAPQLYGFAQRKWIEGLLDPIKVAGPEYFGNTRFAASAMVRYVQGRYQNLLQSDKEAIVEALVAEAGWDCPLGENGGRKELVIRGRELLSQHCTQCHLYQGEGPRGFTPTLDGYGSYGWIVGVIADPTHGLFYGARNDRMPTYWESAIDPGANRLRGDEIAVLAQFLRGEWQEADRPSPPPREPFLLVAGRWEGLRPKVPLPGDSLADRARWLYQRELCSLCHNMTGVEGEEPISAYRPAGADLGRYATREWIAGWLDRAQVGGPKYFGTTAFANGSMVKFVRTSLPELVKDIGKEGLDRLIDTLADWAAQDGPLPKDKIDEEVLLLFEDFTCTDCHSVYGKGGGTGPDLTGYGSRQWTIDILSDPTHKRFYRDRNDGMPSYFAFPDRPEKNLLTQEELELLADWLRRSVTTKSE
jgi:ubiquinol-cytochrome c reductase cytochrome b subunit